MLSLRKKHGWRHDQPYSKCSDPDRTTSGDGANLEQQGSQLWKNKKNKGNTKETQRNKKRNTKEQAMEKQMKQIANREEITSSHTRSKEINKKHAGHRQDVAHRRSSLHVNKVGNIRNFSAVAINFLVEKQ